MTVEQNNSMNHLVLAFVAMWLSEFESKSIDDDVGEPFKLLNNFLLKDGATSSMRCLLGGPSLSFDVMMMVRLRNSGFALPTVKSAAVRPFNIQPAYRERFDKN